MSKFQPGNKVAKGHGRPPGSGRSIKDLIRRFGDWDAPGSLSNDMEKIYGDAAKNLTVDELTWLSVRTLAVQGNSWAVSVIAERTEGKVAHEHRIGNATEGAFEIRIE